MNEFDSSDLDRTWNDTGFGINVEIFGYAKTCKALIRIKHFPYVEIFKLADYSLQEDIQFKKEAISKSLLFRVCGWQGG